MADTVGKQRVRTDANTDVVIRLADTAGTNIAGVSATGSVQSNIAEQTLAGVKISRDGATPTAANGSFVEVTTANAVLAVTNPVPTRLGNGTAFNSATAPIFAQLTNGTAVNAVTAPEFVSLTDGTNPLGTLSNPLAVTVAPGASGTTVYRFNNATVGAGATTNIDYTVTASTTLTIEKLMVSGPAAGNYALIIDPAGTNVTKIKLYTSPGCTVAEYAFERPLTVAAGLVVRVAKNNDDNQTAEMGFVWEGFEV